MKIPPEDSYMMLFNMVMDKKPYQPVGGWCKDRTFAISSFYQNVKQTFKPDYILQQRPSFKPDDF